MFMARNRLNINQLRKESCRGILTDANFRGRNVRFRWNRRHRLRLVSISVGYLRHPRQKILIHPNKNRAAGKSEVFKL